MAEIQLRNLSKRWGDFVGVENFDLTIADQEFLVLLGPSGCGKSTMRMIAGLEDASDGDIIIAWRKVNDVDPKDRDVAMVFRSYGLYPHLNVYENIRFPLRVRKIDRGVHEDRVMRAARMVELEEFLHRKPAELSGGQRQRVALARAIVREPNAVLMDEPLSNLDAKLRVSTRAQITNLSHELKVTKIYVTHDQIEAMTLADRVVVMKAGVVQEIGTPRQIYDRPANAFVAGFIGAPRMNLIDGRVTGGVFTCDGARIGGLSAPDGPASLGFRAEGAAFAEDGETAQITAPLYAVELLGDATMLTVRVGGALVSVKARKDVRAEIFDDLGLDIPQTWDAVLAAAQTIADAGVVDYPLGATMQTGWNRGQDFVNMFYGLGGSFVDDQTMPTLNTEAGVSALGMMAAMTAYMDPEYLVSGPTYVQQEFQQGRIAMANLWSSRAGAMNNDVESGVVGLVETAAAPKATADGPPATTVWRDGVVVARNIPDDRAEAAFRVAMEGLHTQMVQANTDAAIWLIEGYEPPQMAEGAIATMQAQPAPRSYPSTTAIGLMHTALGNGIAAYLTGDKSAEAMLVDIEATYLTAAREAGLVDG